ncbi:hypothetical protein H8356DRAFT_1717231 [Neocallimastix lanati (nom. inval.)]|jgi:hypothetical protein|uniref:Uncharacterized protein n=1 Tax=Neocallimastix californiae TaxID=1754190 RepID=A0A1Y2ATM4_9FUNG|nr:hypothetical protein H8356DRAFT_1717231 [Neocallimastix sp. JGI-2020a]ORY25902.1 hypothetical protein LY90DRAFT_706222 [Neocallimastix californiae]|eukprot:ORY25902.1 hypothetical protein LY90DRAFT_706222 [Neocallimastix californiae]
MKFGNLFFCLIVVFAIQWNTAFANSNEIKLPSIINIEDGEGTEIQATVAIVSYDKDGSGLGYTEDKPLSNCRYDKKNKKVLCDLTYKKSNYYFSFSIKNQGTCKLTNKTTFKKADLYSYDKDEKKYVKDEYLVFLEMENNKIKTFKCTARRFKILTNNKCKLTLDVQRAQVKVVSPKPKKE